MARNSIAKYLLLVFIVTVLFQLNRSAVAQEHLLVNIQAVQDELGVTDNEAVTTKLAELVEKYRKLESMVAFEVTGGRSFMSLPTRQQNEARPKITAKVRELDKLAAEELKLILTEEQITRLAQLRVQAFGAEGIVSGNFKEQIGMDENQLKEMRTSAKAFAESFASDRSEELSKMTQDDARKLFFDEMTAHVLAQLTEEQQQKYKEMTGEPAELPRFKGLR